MTTEYVNVYVLDAPLYADIPYTYYLPPELREQVAPGLFVTVPFGAANRHRAAVVAGFAAPPDEADTIKPVLAILNDRFSLSEELLGLCLFIKEHTLCTFGDAVKAALPAGGLMRQVETYTIWEEMAEKRRGVLMKKCDNTALFIYSYLEQKGSASAQRLRAEFGAATPDALATLLKEKLIRREYQLKGVNNESCTVYLSPAKEESVLRAIAEGAPSAIQKLRSPMQRALLAAVLDGGRQTDKTLMERTGASRAQLNSLVQKGLLNSEKEAVWRDPYKEFKTVPPPPPVTLSEEQEAACATIRALYETHEPKGVLLHGVTGSGKTQVMKAMIDTVIRDGRSVIILVPEIALTPQTVSIFCGYYGDRVAVMHSALSAGERSDAWLRIRDGQIDVVIGTRSAVFAPLPNLGMIILDEEQEHTYKSDIPPRYDAHDVASFRCMQSGALLLLASATPSLTSYYKARSGKYTLVELTKRYGRARLPMVMPVDMRAEIKAGNTSVFSTALGEALRETLARGEQAILFLNRRGYHNYIACHDCGEVLECPNCSVSLTYHKHGLSQHRPGRADAGGTLVCHYCGYRIPTPDKCPSCGSEHLSYTGLGTQKAEAELAELLPEAKVLRMDADTVKNKEAYEEMLSAFRAGKGDILLGTQMVTKGHDFPNVTLVGVLLADASLYAGDFRAAERTFSLVTQVIGRAGRASAKGRAIIQTLNPQNETLLVSAEQNYVKFYQKEIELRRAFLFPPFCDMVEISLSSTDETLLSQASVRLSSYMAEKIKKEYADLPLVLYGPFDAPVYKVQNRYRRRMIVKCKLNRRSRAMFRDILSDFGKSAGSRVTVSADFNPTNI
ncbi:MAG: primosomal protein N' [Clostridia bacterium]|nr:primosomal protein N' [Clostridia bacterium]